MSRRLIVGTVLLAGQFVGSSWAQDAPPTAGAPYPGSSTMSFEWSYSCPGGKGCSFNCPGGRGANQVTKLTIYLGTARVGDLNAPAVFYDFSTREIPRGNGFSISTGIGELSCQVTGMVLDYSGVPK
jgi:hypothetical protein